MHSHYNAFMCAVYLGTIILCETYEAITVKIYCLPLYVITFLYLHCMEP